MTMTFRILKRPPKTESPCPSSTSLETVDAVPTMTLAECAANQLIELLGLTPIREHHQCWSIDDVIIGAQNYMNAPDTSTYFWGKAKQLLDIAKAGRAANDQCLVSV